MGLPCVNWTSDAPGSSVARTCALRADHAACSGDLAMWAQILGMVVGVTLGWALVVTVILYFLGFPPIGEVLNVLFQIITLEKLL